MEKGITKAEAAKEQKDCCPDCDNIVVPSSGCAFCPVCGWSACG